MSGYDEFANYGDPETDPDAALLDHELRQLFNDIPDSGGPGAELPPEVAAEIARAVELAWPDGKPPTPDEVARDDGQLEISDDSADFDAHRGDGPHGDHFDHHDIHHDQGHDHTDHGEYGHHDFGPG
ncbi:hypothetical protein [Mycobacterium sp. 1245805.9]|uniref:hypothetical protein n=1 Tax=Mycobacterium sp. 1245805.9 TaxID=1856862 RepID=UPI0007FF721C|nr:hypothetical protein [Mycobacterium sp. 1245805.9]OBI84433.1 hypothetical protein A9X00_03300 [Mycobacterium sp. 1245805.9]